METDFGAFNHILAQASDVVKDDDIYRIKSIGEFTFDNDEYTITSDLYEGLYYKSSIVNRVRMFEVNVDESS